MVNIILEVSPIPPSSADRKESKEKRKPSNSLITAQTAAQTAADNRGRDIIILDMRKLSPLFDYFVLVTGTSRRQLRSISGEIVQVLKHELGQRKISSEGTEDSRWILLDYGDVIVHLFDEEMRTYYDLEQLWSDAKIVTWEEKSKTVSTDK